MTPERETKLKRVLSFRQPELTVVMENVNDPHNIMAVARSCDAVGIQTIHIVNTQLKEQFVEQNKGLKSSSSANKWVDFLEHDSIEACFTLLKAQEFHILCTHLSADATDLHETDFTQKVALVFGNEKDGITDNALKLADGNFIIPQMGMIQSLNISVACAVSLYEAFRQRRKAGFYQQQQLSDSDYSTIFSRWSSKAPKL